MSGDRSEHSSFSWSFSWICCVYSTDPSGKELVEIFAKEEVQLGRWWETFCRADQRDLIQLARAPAPKASSLWEEPHELPAAAPWQVALCRSVPLKPCQSQFGVKWEHVVHQRRHSAPFIVVLLMWKCHPLAIKSASACWSCYQQPLFVAFSWWLLVSTSSSVFCFFLNSRLEQPLLALLPLRFFFFLSLKDVDWLWNPIECFLMENVRIDFRALREMRDVRFLSTCYTYRPPHEICFFLRLLSFCTTSSTSQNGSCGLPSCFALVKPYPALRSWKSGKSLGEREKLEARKGWKAELEKSMKGPFSGGKENRRVGKLD